MKSKYLIITVVFSALFFVLGFYINRPTEDDSAVLADTVSVEAKNDVGKPIIETSSTSKTDYSKVLKGKFILADANYAGYEFIDHKTITWTNEMFPMDPDTMSLKWIDESTFITKFTKKVNNNCSPAISILKVVSYNDDKLVLKDYWTGWNDKKDEVSTFYRSRD